MFNVLSRKLTLLSLIIGASAFVTTSANAALVVSNSDIVVTGEEDNISQVLDLNGDGFPDVNFSILNGYVLGEVPVVTAGILGQTNYIDNDESRYTTSTSFHINGFGQLINYKLGDSISVVNNSFDNDYEGPYLVEFPEFVEYEDESSFNPEIIAVSEVFTSSDGVLYQEFDNDYGFPPNLIPSVGDTAFIGYQLTKTSEDMQNGFETYTGFIQVTHGSIKVGQVGFQNTAFAAAVIPNGEVSAPTAASLMLIALGAMLFGRKFRK